MERLLGPALPDLAQLLPELAAHAQASDAVPLQGKRRIHFALSSVFSQLAARQPLLLLLEDLPWADDSSLEVVAALAGRIPRERILLIGTYREDEISPALRTLLNELDRSRAALELRLNRLQPDGVGAMLSAIFKRDRPLRTDVVDAIYSLTDGNPFFVEELVRSLPWLNN
jgi:predicted ATPase